MKAQIVSLLGLLATSAVAELLGERLQLLKVLHGDRIPPHFERLVEAQVQAQEPSRLQGRADAGSKSHHNKFLNEKTEKFAVNGTGIPEVSFNVGHSFSGLLPISDKKDDKNELFFWFFPTDNEEHRDKKEIIIWLNGGPGCSSLMGLLLEMGPFVWRPGTLHPAPNPWSWHHLTNVVWIEQPVTVGYSTGNTTIHDEDELAKQFMGFWKNFVETFSLQGYKIYIAAESYGGMYGPYISSHFLDAKDTTHFDLAGLMVVDGVGFHRDVQWDVPVEGFFEQNYRLVPLDDDAMKSIRNVSKACGYRDFVNKYYTYPPAGVQPADSELPWLEKLPNGTLTYKEGCGMLWYTAGSYAMTDNPCFNWYNIQDECPIMFDPIRADVPYFDRPDVKKALHAPDKSWSLCVETAFVPPGDQSPAPFLRELPHVIEKTKNVLLSMGGTDYIVSAPGILLGVQNMTWGGKLGFQSRPSEPFYVPRWGFGERRGNYYGSQLPDRSGVVGTTHSERGLTIAVAALAGHEGPQYSSTAAFRQLEKLLGRVHRLDSNEPFTLPELRRVRQDPAPLGKGTYPVPFEKKH